MAAEYYETNIFDYGEWSMPMQVLAASELDAATKALIDAVESCGVMAGSRWRVRSRLYLPRTPDRQWDEFVLEPRIVIQITKHPIL